MKRKELPPPTCYMKTLLTSPVENAFRKINKVISESLNVLENQEALTVESYVLSRMIYKMNNQWRGEKTLQGLKRIHTTLKQHQELKVIEYLKELREHFKECNLHVGEIYLPAQQMMVYLLRQIMGLSYLVAKTCGYCQYTYIYISQYLAIGNFIPQNMIFLSLVSRIWTLCRSLTLHSVTWYTDIYSILDVFPQTQVTVDKEGLPKDLKCCLNMENDVVNRFKLCQDSPVPVPTDSISNIPIDALLEDSDIDSETELKIKKEKPESTCDELVKGHNTFKKSANQLENTEMENLEGVVMPKNPETSNKWKLNDIEDLGSNVLRKDKNSTSSKSNSKDLYDRCMSVDGDEDCGLIVSREITQNHVTNSNNMESLKNKILKCNSFKKLRLLLEQFGNSEGKTEQFMTCEKRLKRLKKKHLVVIRNGVKDNTLLLEAKEVLRNLVDSTNSSIVKIEKPRNSNKIREKAEDVSNCESIRLKNEDFLCCGKIRLTDSYLEDIFKKPYKGLVNLVEKQFGSGLCITKDKKIRLKQCAAIIKTLRKTYRKEVIPRKKKQCIKKARKEVKNLLKSLF